MRILLICFFFIQCVHAQNLYPIQKKGKWGYMNAEGKILIDFKYDMAQNFNEGYAVVALNRMPCLIDVKENRAIDTGLYQYIGQYSEGLVSVMDYKFRRFYLNAKSNIVISLDKNIYDAQPFYRGVARIGKKVENVTQKFGADIVDMGYRFAYIKRDGTLATGFDFDDCDDFIDHPVRFMHGQKFGLLDSTGKVILKATYNNISAFNEGLAVVDLNGKYGFINKQGIETIKPQFEYARMFNNGLAAADAGGLTGFIDTNGNWVIEPKFEEVRPFGNNRAGVKFNGKWAMIDATGKFIYDPKFDDIGYFEQGICPVKLNKKWGAIDLTGRVVIPFDFEYISAFENGIAQAIYRGINFYINTRGELLPKLN